MKIQFVLEKAARSTGGDKYSADCGFDKPFTVYFPQEISRENGKVKDELTIEMEV